MRERDEGLITVNSFCCSYNVCEHVLIEVKVPLSCYHCNNNKNNITNINNNNNICNWNKGKKTKTNNSKMSGMRYLTETHLRGFERYKVSTKRLFFVRGSWWEGEGEGEVTKVKYQQ